MKNVKPTHDFFNNFKQNFVQWSFKVHKNTHTQIILQWKLYDAYNEEIK